MDSKDLSDLIDLRGNSGQLPQGSLSLESLVNDLVPPEKNERDLEQWLAAGPASANSLAGFVPALVGLTQDLSADLKQNQFKLLSLNRSRREEIVSRLQSLAQLQPNQVDLGAWLTEHHTSGAQAIAAFLEEISLVVLGQALVLKSWSDRGIRPMQKADLANLNWALASHLKRFTAHGRDTWQLTRPNIYSWYNPSLSLQARIWETLHSWNLRDDSPAFLTQILRAARRHEPINAEHRGYDFRFFRTFWESMGAFGIDLSRPKEEGPISRPHQLFCPTLRDGSILRSGPRGVQWHGLDADPFLTFLTELSVLWQGPQAAPALGVGFGLECQAREQLTLALQGPSRGIAIERLSDLESCDLAVIIEERAVRMSTRSPEVARIRRAIDTFGLFKKLKYDGTSLGTLQAITATAKLRPDGLLFWFREEPLSPGSEGGSAIAAIFERARLVAQWDLSQVSHSLPASLPLFPKHLILLARDPSRERRLASVPKTFVVQGTIRSHVEVPMFLAEVLTSIRGQSIPRIGRNPWQILCRDNMGTLQDWLQVWPDGADREKLTRLERMRRGSLPLGQVLKIRPNSGALPHADLLLFNEDTVDRSGAISVKLAPGEAFALSVEQGVSIDPHGYNLRGDEEILRPVSEYLTLGVVTMWLEANGERRRGPRSLKEEALATIPVPIGLTREESDEPTTEFKAVCKQIRATLDQNRALFRMVTQSGTVAWSELLTVLPPSEKLPFAVHPALKVSGNLPHGVPILEIRAVKTPRPLMIFATESGLMNQVASDDPLFIDILEQALAGAVSPTWGELVQSVMLPRTADSIRQTAHELLASHATVRASIAASRESLERLASRMFGWG